jgi:hypothetical protein
MYEVNLSHQYSCNQNELFELFKNLTVFKLTGADDIHASFVKDNSFNLIFRNRGEIFGKILQCDVTEIILDWNVQGFGREEENGTIVKIVLEQDKDICNLSLSHTGIKNADARLAKQNAWNEILINLESEIPSLTG